MSAEPGGPTSYFYYFQCDLRNLMSVLFYVQLHLFKSHEILKNICSGSFGTRANHELDAVRHVLKFWFNNIIVGNSLHLPIAYRLRSSNHHYRHRHHHHHHIR